MFFTSKIINPNEGLDVILDAVIKFNADRFLYALKYKNWDEGYIERMSKETSLYKSRLEQEYIKLKEFSKNFNKEFTTVNNACFDSALILLRKIRSGISETKRIYEKYCPRARQEKAYSYLSDINRPVSAYRYSYISTDTYQLSLFQFEGYPPCIRGLYNEMEKFFQLLIQSIRLCKSVLLDEQKIKKDSKYCKYLYDKFKEKFLKEIRCILKQLPSAQEALTAMDNPAIASRNSYDNDEAWAPVGFHQFNINDVKLLVAKQELDEQAMSNMTSLERRLFGNDQDKAFRCRYVIQHFDECLPEDYSKKKLDAKAIQMLFQYFGIQHGCVKDAVRYFESIYTNIYGHKYEMVKYAAISAYKDRVKKDEKGEYKTFVRRVEKLLNPQNNLRIASNF